MSLKFEKRTNHGDPSQLVGACLPNQSHSTEVSPLGFYAELTDPRKHNPGSFRYIVHGINPSGPNDLLLLAMTQGGYDHKQEINLLAEPERIAEKKIISTSIIDHGLQGTWGDVFFILDVPWSNFVSMSPRDSATNVTNPDFVLENARPPHLLPSQLVAQTKCYGGNSAYNEVVITGTASDQKVKIIGVGIKLTDVGDDKLKQPQHAERIREIAKMLEVPIIELVDVVRIQDSSPEINYTYGEIRHVRSVYLNQDGYRYCFQADWDSPELKDAFRGDKNTYGGYNAISSKEYQRLRAALQAALTTKEELFFLDQLDRKFLPL